MKEERHRLHNMTAKEFFTNGYAAWTSMKELEKQGQYEAAGVAFVRNLFPDKYEPMES
jgi:hypothetical protein